MRTGRNKTLTISNSGGITNSQNRSQKEVPCRSMDFNTLSAFAKKQSRTKGREHELMFLDLKKYVALQSYKNGTKLRQFMRYNNLKLKKPKSKILSNACISKALKKDPHRFKYFKPKYPTMAE